MIREKEHPARRVGYELNSPVRRKDIFWQFTCEPDSFEERFHFATVVL